MVLWFAIAQIALSVLGALTSLVVYLRKSAPNDFVLGGTLLVGVLLLIQIVVSIFAPMLGNQPAGDLLEFWMYLTTATVLPFAAGVWALIDRRTTANLVLLVVHLSVAVMLLRMLVIWD